MGRGLKDEARRTEDETSEIPLQRPQTAVADPERRLEISDGMPEKLNARVKKVNAAVKKLNAAVKRLNNLVKKVNDYVNRINAVPQKANAVFYVDAAMP